MKKRVTLKDIAEHCGLAVTTVSRILRDKSTYCSAAKIEMVKRVAAEWEYRPNIGYQIMTGRNTDTAAIIFSQQRVSQEGHINRFYMSLAGKLDERGFASYTAILDGKLDSQLRKLRELDERGCRHYYFIGSPAYYEEVFAFLERMKRNYIGFNSIFCARNLALDHGGAIAGYRILAERAGCKHFVIASTERNFESRILIRLNLEQQTEFRKCLFPVSPIGFIQGNSVEHYFRLGRQTMAEIIEQKPETDAVVFSSDFHVLGAAEILRERGLYGKIKLFGIGASAAAGFAGVKFTSAAFDVEKGAAFLVENITSAEEWEEFLPGTIVEYEGGSK